MGFFAEPLLREARDKINSQAESSFDAKGGHAEFDRLADAVEKAIKAALLENHGSIPKHHDHNKLVTICQSTGVWEILPPALKNLVQEVETYRATPEQVNEKLPTQSSAEQLQRYFFVARRLIDYMEFHVIGNDSVIKRLKVL